MKETQCRNDPVHYFIALAMQAEMLVRHDLIKRAVEIMEDLKGIYNVELHSNRIASAYGSDRAGQCISQSALLNECLGRHDQALVTCDHVINDLLPHMDPQNVYNSFHILYSIIWVMKDSGRAREALEAFDRFVVYNFTTRLDARGLTSDRPLHAPIMALLDMVGTNCETDRLDEYAEWALDFLITPGELQGSDFDQSILQAILANPQKPEVNELFVFNQFAVLPLALANVALPQASNKGPPPTLFLVGASFLGYFIFGLYMLLRGSPKEATRLQDLGWITANVFENKLFNAGALVLSLYFATQISWSEFDSTAQGFVDMWKMSKFVSVSSVDPSILTRTIAALISQDYRVRNPEGASRANLIAASTLLLPVYGALIYCFL